MDEPEAGSSHDAKQQEVPQSQNPVLLLVSWHQVRMAIMRADKDTPDADLVKWQNALNRVENFMHEYAVGVLEEVQRVNEEKNGGGKPPTLSIVKS